MSYNTYEWSQITKKYAGQHIMHMGTVNLEIFLRTLFLRNFAYAKFREN